MDLEKYVRMIIRLKSVSKRYTEEWILRNINLELSFSRTYGIEGANGSGKSTLVRMMCGFLSPSIGTITYFDRQQKEVSRDDIYKYCSLWGPHINLIGELTIAEMVDYFLTFKNLRRGYSKADFYHLAQLPVKKHRQVKSLSSGQAQRLGLSLAVLADTDILILDEPGSFLDVSSLDWFYNLLESNRQGRLVIIASNEATDLSLAEEKIRIEDYK